MGNTLEANRQVSKFRHWRWTEADVGEVLFSGDDAASVLCDGLVHVGGLQLQGGVLAVPNWFLVDEVFLQKTIRLFI